MKLNRPPNRPRPHTHEGAPAAMHLSHEAQLRRSVMACMLWEDEFYEDGQTISDRIGSLAREVNPQAVASIAIEAREEQNLRHVPLLLCAHLARFAGGSSLVSNTLERVIQRADELAEFLAIYAKLNEVTPDKLKPVLSNQVRKGLGRAFTKFDAYQLAKYDRAGAIRLRDALFLCHAKAKDTEQEALWKRLIDGTLEAPDTWEVGLTRAGQKAENSDEAKEAKGEVFTRLLQERKLGYMALLKNLRNMTEAGVDKELIASAIIARKGGAHRVLPFRYVAAARACPQLEPHLDAAMLAAQDEQPQWLGRTAILVDVSGSMGAALSARSDMSRMDAACALAALVPAENKRVFSFSQSVVEVPPRRGMAMIDAIQKSQPHGVTYLGAAVTALCREVPHDRLIVITDEQSHDPVGAPKEPNSWMVNIASARNGVGYGKKTVTHVHASAYFLGTGVGVPSKEEQVQTGWMHLDGWSESIIRYIAAVEGVDESR